jgi:hypothetical protein
MGMSIGKLDPNESRSEKGLGDKSPPMNYVPDIYINDISLPGIKKK